MKKLLLCTICAYTSFIYASSNNQIGLQSLFYLFVIMLFVVLSRFITKINQPMVLGQLLCGISLGVLAHYKLFTLQDIAHNPIIYFLAELGSIFLLFEIGLESSLSDIKNAGYHAIIVAIVGVVLPFILGYFVLVPYILHSNDISLQLFFGSMLAVTSTGISVSVFKDLKILKSPPCQIVLTASVIDDICGLILLSITTSLVIDGVINITTMGFTLWYVLLFFTLGIVFGVFILPTLMNIISKINNNIDTGILFIIAFCLLMSYCAGKIGLAFIIGAFISGLLVNAQLFKNFLNNGIHNNQTISNHQLEELITPYGKFFTPIFFIYAGMQVDIIEALNIHTLYLGAVISLIAIIGKLFCGIFLPSTINKWIVGLGMMPRGEIGLIFALTGLQLHIIDQNLFTSILLMIIITSIITPIAINHWRD